jgi:acetyl esterase/lipase
MILGNLDLYDGVVSAYVTATGVPFLSVNYRLAPEVHDTTLAEDAFAGVTWLIAQASNLEVDTHRIAIMGDSGGGGVAAGVAIVARERQFALARQILIYPMLDDRNSVPNALLTPFATWTYDQNYTAWNAVLDGKQGSEPLSESIAPEAVHGPRRVSIHSGMDRKFPPRLSEKSWKDRTKMPGREPQRSNRSRLFSRVDWCKMRSASHPNLQLPSTTIRFWSDFPRRHITSAHVSR